MNLQAYSFFIFFLPKSQKIPCPDPSNIEHSACALRVQLMFSEANLLKAYTPIYWFIFSPDLSWSQGAKNPREKGGNPPIGGKIHPGYSNSYKFYISDGLWLFKSKSVIWQDLLSTVWAKTLDRSFCWLFWITCMLNYSLNRQKVWPMHFDSGVIWKSKTHFLQNSGGWNCLSEADQNYEMLGEINLPLRLWLLQIGNKLYNWTKIFLSGLWYHEHIQRCSWLTSI